MLEHYYPYIGGAETLFQRLAEGLAAEGHDVRVATLLHDPELSYFEVYHQVEIYRLRLKNRYWFTFFSWPRIWQLAKDVDLIHTTSYNAALPAWIVGKLRRKLVVITFHEVWGRLWLRLPFISRIAAYAFYAYERFLLSLSFQHYIAVSSATQRSLEAAGIAPQRISRIYNGLDEARLRSSLPTVPVPSPTEFTFTYFGRLGISKGLDLLIPAAAIFSRKHPNTKLQLIIPRVPAGMFRRIMALIEEHQLGDQVKLYHALPRASLMQKIASTSCVVIPSYSEGFCFVAVESALLGRPIVSSGQTALAETVSGHYLEMEAMTVEALVEALEKARHQDYLYRPLRPFPLSDSIAEYVDFYRGLLKP